MAKLKIFLFDLFFIISGFVGVGFATGKELEQFFLHGKSLFISVVIFFVIYFSICTTILNLRNKYNIKNLKQLNKFVFGEYDFAFNVFLLILFLITSSAMLAGCDNILKNLFKINLPIGSLLLSIITIFVCTKDIKAIKKISNIIIPVLILFLCINIVFNKGEYEGGNSSICGVIFPVLFCCENCVMLISVLLKTKSNSFLLSLFSGGILSFILFFATQVVANFSGDMPLLLASKNVTKVFYFCYLFGVIFALFLTLQISQYNACEIFKQNNKNTKFKIIFLTILAQIISFLGFDFIVKYLYSLMGFCGVIYLIILFIKIIIKNKY